MRRPNIFLFIFPQLQALKFVYPFESSSCEVSQIISLQFFIISRCIPRIDGPVNLRTASLVDSTKSSPEFSRCSPASHLGQSQLRTQDEIPRWKFDERRSMTRENVSISPVSERRRCIR